MQRVSTTERLKPKALAPKNIKAKRLIKKTVNYLAIVLIGLFLLFPFMYMISKSLMKANDANHINPVYFFPQNGATLSNYIPIFDSQYLRYLGNTLIIVIFNMIAVPVSSSMCAFAFSKLQWKGRSMLFSMVLATMMIPSFIVQVPQYVIFTLLGWTSGSYMPLLIPNLLGGGAVNIFLMRQFMRGIPNSLDEAAKIDGANAFMRYIRIVLPLCLPVLIFISVGVFMANWSDFSGPLIYLRGNLQKRTLALAIYDNMILGGSGSSNSEIRAAMGVFMSIPPAILFFIFQHQLIDGVQMGAIKG